MSTISTDVTDWIAEYADKPEEVREFCTRHGILDYVRTTVEMTKQCFAPLHSLTLSIATDPCDGRVTAHVEVEASTCEKEIHASVKDIQSRYYRFLDEWSGTIPYPECNLVSFDYHIA